MAQKTHFKIEGSGEAVLMLHGFGANKDTWNYVKPHLVSQYQVITLDLPGSGFTPNPEGRTYSLDSQAEFVQEFIEQHKLKRVTIVGSSYGGGIALLAASRYSEAGKSPISALVLIGSMAYKQKLPWYISLLRTPVINKLAAYLIPVHKLVMMVYRMSFFDHSRIPEDLAKSYADSLSSRESKNALMRMAKAIQPDEYREVAQKYSVIKMPVLLLWGEHDRVVPVWVGEKLQADLQDARLEVIKNCGHVPQEECPVETAEFLLDFLARQE